MAINYAKLMAWPFEDVRHRYTQRDTMLYALGVGLGTDPLNETELRFVYEKNLLALPTLPVVLGYIGMWMKDPTTGIDAVRLVHGEQGLVIRRLPPPEGEVIGRTKVAGIVDKGTGKGGLVYTERTVHDAASGEFLAMLTSTAFCRADGGFGGPTGPAKTVHELSTRAANHSVYFATQPRRADLPALGRLQPAACRTRGGQRRTLRAALPERPADLWHCRLGPHPKRLRWRPKRPAVAGCALFVTGLSRQDDTYRSLGGWQGRFVSGPGCGAQRRRAEQRARQAALTLLIFLIPFFPFFNRLSHFLQGASQ